MRGRHARSVTLRPAARAPRRRTCALRAFDASLAQIRAFAPQVRSGRGVASVLGVASQHGDGGARSIFLTVARPGMAEAELLAAMEEESVRRVTARFGPGDGARGTRSRRRAFRTTSLLADSALDPS